MERPRLELALLGETHFTHVYSYICTPAHTHTHNAHGLTLAMHMGTHMYAQVCTQGHVHTQAFVTDLHVCKYIYKHAGTTHTCTRAQACTHTAHNGVCRSRLPG